MKTEIILFMNYKGITMKRFFIALFLIFMIASYSMAQELRIDGFTNDTTVDDADEFIFWNDGESAVRNINWDSLKTQIYDGINWSEFTNDQGFITGLNWDEIGGLQSSINISGFTNDSGFTTNTGDVTASSNFGTDNRLIKSDGTGKGVQVTGITISDTTNNISGVGTLNTHTIPSGTGTIALTSSNVATATALAANGTNCSAGSYPLGVDASGAAESCTDATTEINSSITTHASDADAHQDLVTLSGTNNYLTISGQAINRGDVALGTHTSGNYVASATSNQGLVLTGTEGASLGLIECSESQILKRGSSSNWECASDSVGEAGGGITGLTADSGGSTTGTTVTLTGGDNITTTRSTDTITFDVSINWDEMPLLVTADVNWSDFDLTQASGYNNTNWDTAYGWGDHSSEGYLTDVNWSALNWSEVDLSSANWDSIDEDIITGINWDSYLGGSGTSSTECSTSSCDLNAETTIDGENIQRAKDRTVCAVVEDLAEGDDDFAFYMASEAITITSVGCNCRGTCSTLATFTLEDRGGNAMTITGTNPTCATTGAATFAAVTANNTLTAGEMIAFNVTNTPTADDTYAICVSYSNQ
jgi:hypothetical protein